MPLFNNGKKSSDKEPEQFDLSQLSFPFLIDEEFDFSEKPVKSKQDVKQDEISASKGETEEKTEEPEINDEKVLGYITIDSEETEDVIGESSAEEPEINEEAVLEYIIFDGQETEDAENDVSVEEPTKVLFEESVAEDTLEVSEELAEEILEETSPEETAEKVVVDSSAVTDISPKEAPSAEQQEAPIKAPTPVFTSISAKIPARSPLQSVLSSVKQTAAEILDNIPTKSQPSHDENPPLAEVKSAPVKAPEKEQPVQVILKPEVILDPKPTATEPVVKTSTLLAKCMPYIYDDDGVNYVEEKPNYTLESVEDIISTVEQKANEKIAKMYGLDSLEVDNANPVSPLKEEAKAEVKPKVEEPIQEEVKPETVKIGQEVKPSASFDTTSFPKVSATLFDDFSSRRTEMSDTGPITTTYTQFNEMQSNAEDSHTRVIPDLKVDSKSDEVFEDISSYTAAGHTTSEIPRFSHKPDIDFSPDDTEIDEDIKEFGGAEDVKRVGGELKFNMLLCRARLVVTTVLTLLAGAMHFPAVGDFISGTPLFAEIAGLVIFALAVIVNINVIASVKTAFSKHTKVELPLAFALILMGLFLIFGAVSANFVYDIIILPTISLLIYTFCSYLKSKSIWNNFKIVASRKPKTAVALISDPATTSAMARSIIEGDILAAGSRETDEIDDFLKNSFADRPFQGRLNSFTIASLITALVVGIIVGISHSSFSDAFCAAASSLCLAASPSLFVADMLPFAGLSRRLYPLKAAVCSKFSAERIELLNAVVLPSADIFPDDCIKLYSMRPLSSNTLDETIALAAAVAAESNSPLKNLFLGMLSDDSVLPETDSVKYEDNLGISGWADDHHIMIGNRSIMEAHGVRIPSLDVDRKILHKGFFPVYVACDQRACALLTVKYTIDREVEYELGRLADKGVTLLVDNCDPNITEEMLCDYYSLFPDLIKILDHHGVGKYRTAVSPTEKVSAHGFYKDSALGFISLINGCIRLRTVSNALVVIHIISAVLCWLVYTGLSVGGTMALVSGGLAALCSLATLVVSLVTYFIGKP